MLKLTDDQGIEVDEDVFPELASVKDVCFVIYTDDGKVVSVSVLSLLVQCP